MTELEETRAALRDLYWQLYGRPAKHPQQLEQRKRAAALLGLPSAANVGSRLGPEPELVHGADAFGQSPDVGPGKHEL